MTKSEEKPDNSIVPAKYRDKYRGTGDWLKQFINGQIVSTVMRDVTTKDEDGNETTESVATKKTSMDLNKLFDLAAANNIDARGKYAAQADAKNAAGRLRMTIGNMLRAAAKHRHGLFDLDGEWHDAEAEFLGEAERTHERDGTKIAKAKPEPETEDSEAA